MNSKQAIPSTYEELLPQFLVLSKNYEKLQGEHELLKAEVAQLKRMIFGARSERFTPSSPPSQAELPLDAERVAEVEVTKKEITYTRTTVKKKENNNHKGRLPLPAHLPRVVIELEPEENVEGCTEIGKEITEELDYTPGKLFVNQYVRKKYASKEPERLITAPLPARPIDKGIPAPGLLAQILIDKYVDHLPLYRQQQRFIREGVRIAESTLCDWVKYSLQLLFPLYEILKKEVLSTGYLMADETPMKVLDRNKKNAAHQGYYWVYRSPEKGPVPYCKSGLVLFEYQKGRGRDGPAELLRDFKGFLQTDGYSVYDVLAEKKKDIILLGCMSHARRYFDKALDNDRVRASYMLELFQQLYAIERKAKEKELLHAQRKELRTEESVPVLQEMEKWLKGNLTQTLPQSAIGKAIAYTLSRWGKLTLYTAHGHLEIDNNPVENAIRPLALGRKNYLFAGSHEAAQRAAMIYSLLGTCKINNINPHLWLKETLTQIPQLKVSEHSRLLPVPKKEA